MVAQRTLSARACRAALRVFAVLAALAAGSAAAQNLLWEVTSLSNRVWLFGTVHAGRADWYPLPRTVEDAFESAPALFVEADITDAAAMAKSAAATVYTPPDALRQHVPAGDYARLLKLLPRYGLTEAEVARMKPFMAASLLVFQEWARQGYPPRYAVDAYLLERAKAEHKRVVELEGVDAQIRLMDTLTDREDETYFHSTVGALESGLTAGLIRGIVRAWQVGDPQVLLDASRRYNERVPGAAALEERFVWSRNPHWLEAIETLLDRSNEPAFVAVGALHLVGPRGLVEQLRAHGYTVRHVFVASREETQK